MGELPEAKMCFCRTNALIPCSFGDSKINIIVLINGCFHNGPVICPRLVIMAQGRAIMTYSRTYNRFILTIFSYLFLSEWKRNIYFSIMYVYCIYPVISKAPKKLSNCLKRAETSVVLIVFDCVLVLTGQRRNSIKTSYVSILRLPSFYLY